MEKEWHREAIRHIAHPWKRFSIGGLFNEALNGMPRRSKSPVPVLHRSENAA